MSLQIYVCASWFRNGYEMVFTHTRSATATRRFIDLKLFKLQKMDFHHYIPESKRPSAKWTVTGQNRLNQPKVEFQGYSISILGHKWNFVDQPIQISIKTAHPMQMKYVTILFLS